MVMAIIVDVDVLVVELVCKWNHLAHARPVAGEAAVHREDVDPLEFGEANRLGLEEVRVLAQAFVELVPRLHHLIILLLCFRRQRLVLKPCKIIIIPVHQDIRFLGPHFYHLIILALLFLLHLP